MPFRVQNSKKCNFLSKKKTKKKIKITKKTKRPTKFFAAVPPEEREALLCPQNVVQMNARTAVFAEITLDVFQMHNDSLIFNEPIRSPKSQWQIEFVNDIRKDTDNQSDDTQQIERVKHHQGLSLT